MGYHYTMGAKCITTKLSKIKIKSTEPESNPHHLVTTEESCR